MAAADLEKLQFREIPKAERRRRWNEFLSDTYSVFRTEPAEDTFSATISRIRIGRLGLSWYETTAAKGFADAGRAGAWSAPIGDAFVLAIQQHGVCTGHYQGRDIVTKPGDMVLLDVSRQYGVSTSSPMKVVAIKIPADLVLRIFPDPEGACGVRLSAQVPEIALASSLLLGIKDAIEASPTADWESYEDVLINIIRSAFHHVPENIRHVSRSGSPKREACAFIERNLSDPDLNIRRIAEELDMSTRSIQRIFGEMGFTPRGYILERRIDAAAERLRRADFQHTSITDIAFAVGFSDLSHFVRCFRGKFGVSPRDYRMTQRAPSIDAQPTAG